MARGTFPKFPLPAGALSAWWVFLSSKLWEGFISPFCCRLWDFFENSILRRARAFFSLRSLFSSSWPGIFTGIYSSLFSWCSTNPEYGQRVTSGWIAIVFEGPSCMVLCFQSVVSARWNVLDKTTVAPCLSMLLVSGLFSSDFTPKLLLTWRFWIWVLSLVARCLIFEVTEGMWNRSHYFSHFLNYQK